MENSSKEGFMSKQEERRPSIRFKGYTEPWEQRKLGEVAEFTKGRGYSKGDIESSGVPIILYGRLYTDYQTIIGDVDTYVTMKNHSVLSEGNEIIVPSSGESSEEISRASVVAKKGVILGGDLNIIRLTKKFSSVFVAITLSNGSQQKELSKRAQGKSVVHLHNSDLKEVNLFFPTLPEQTAIGSFFQELDQLITLQQRELELMKEGKKTLLSKMFPKDGENFPEIRFPGFTNAWEQRKLGEVAEFTKGRGYSKGDIESSGVPIILYGRLYTDYQTIIGDVDTYVTMKNHSVLSEGNEIIVPSSGESSEEISRASVVAKKGVILGGDLNIIRLTKKFSSVFVAITLSNGSQQKELSKRAQGKSVVHLHNSDLKEVNLFFPTLPEQTAIGSFFQELDQLITLQQRELEILKTMKSTLLKAMFA